MVLHLGCSPTLQARRPHDEGCVVSYTRNSPRSPSRAFEVQGCVARCKETPRHCPPLSETSANRQPVKVLEYYSRIRGPSSGKPRLATYDTANTERS